MLAFIFGVILVIAAAIVFKYRTAWEMPNGGKWLTVGIALVGVALTVYSFTFTVGTKEEAIVTSFGTTVGHTGSGIHLKGFWEAVHTMDAAIQTDTYASEKSDTKGASASGPCIQTRIANQQVACVDISIRWRIKPNSSDELYRDYRSFDHVRNSLVTRELKAAVNQQLSAYNPLNAITAGTPASGGGKNPTNAQLGTDIRRQMGAEIGNRIDVLSAIVSFIGFDQETQARLNQLQQQLALTRVAEQRQATNDAEAKANKALASSVNSSPNVLVSRCLDDLDTMVKQKQPIPAGFSCWPNGGVSGVIANASAGTGK